jgi:hypothetical protein
MNTLIFVEMQTARAHVGGTSASSSCRGRGNEEATAVGKDKAVSRFLGYPASRRRAGR